MATARGQSADGGDLSRLRQLNERAVLAAVRAAGELRAAQIVERSGLGRTAVEDVLAGLVDRRWLVEGRAEVRGRGRPARSYRFRAEAGYVVGLDIGAYSIRSVLADLGGRVLATSHRRVSPDTRRADRLAAADRAIADCARGAGVATSRIWSVGVGTTGLVDREGRVVRVNAIPDWAGADLAAHFRRSARLVVVDNDSQLAALAEHRLGVATDVADLVLLHAGRRTGLALVVDGTLRRGFHGAAADLSTLPMLRWEPAIDYLHHCRAVPPDVPLADRAEHAFAAAREGRRAAVTAVRRYAREMALAAATAVGVVDPQVVVLGGAFSQAADVLLEPLTEELTRLFPQGPEVRASTLGADCVALGSVCLALDALDERLVGAGRGALPVLAARSV
ncbi:Sugar kinase of the NBD/HSP70 family, may contain an N-terminal HTH domain [Actinopolymorpha cephalotaxi]|uniref:NBD/HSP70 family sugar kinase n=1 Tax=Actinopolymorpha cephalotaxi TaxID=504797 RepID=A0A1I2YNF3_9ACTN|nr:ROK family protein [Actinopolymorpha cephalotaxi]NYH86867.1 putative NBD/HSP70 family sugar kinase [Actinopolymorpha cephalotaxi]SFH27108.1 Sugar kinase of the NBD/HSP70 family, may contain an N-terminal HTH domain [Actinopolymorpha cephalotaxi]